MVKVYKVALGFTPAGDKAVEGDGRTPEGEFYAFVKNDQSRFAFSLGISYPGIEDARRGLAEKLITRDEFDAIETAIERGEMPPQKTALGGEIYIHGGGATGDWTDGCIALTDTEIKELFDSVEVGVRITILP